MSDDLITSTSNPIVKRLRKLRNRRFREAEGVFLIEGIAHVRQGVDHGARFESILVAPELLSSAAAWEVVRAQEAIGTQVVYLAREAFESVTERDHPSGLAATVMMEQRDLSAAAVEKGDVFLGLVDVGNPGNLGSIIRTIDAVDGAGCVVVGDSTDEYHPVATKASMGTLFTVPVFRAATIEALLEWAAANQVAVITTSAKATTAIWDVPLTTPALFLFGSEAVGLPVDVLERGSHSVCLPMEGAASSLNLAVAVGIVLYESKRRLKS